MSAKIASRNLPKRRARTILTVTAVFLGVALLVGINMATASALGEFNSYINKFWGATDIVVTYGNEQSFADQTLSIVQNIRDAQNQSLVKETAERFNWFGATVNSASNVSFFLDGINPANDFDYSSFNVTGTRQFSTGQAVVDSIVAQKLRIGVGSSIDVATGIPTANMSQFQPVLFPLKVVGINYPLRNIGSTVYMYLPELQSVLGQQGKITHIYASLFDPTKALEAEKELLKTLPSSYDVSAPKAEAVQRIDAQTAGFSIGLNVMIGVSLVVCAFIVFNTLFMTVSERYFEIGILRAVGSSRGQIFRIFLAEGILIGVLGTLTGIFGGLGLARMFTFIFETSFDVPSLPVAKLTPSIALAGLASGFGSVLGGALYPAISASRVNIIQAIRPSARNSRRQIPLLFVGLVGAVMLGLGAGESLRVTPFTSTISM